MSRMCWLRRCVPFFFLWVARCRWFWTSDSFRRHGVGSWLLQKILSTSHMGYNGRAFCWPTRIGSTTNNAEWMNEQAAITALLHFVAEYALLRIPSCSTIIYLPSFFPRTASAHRTQPPCLPSDSSHPSRKFAVASEPETPSWTSSPPTRHPRSQPS